MATYSKFIQRTCLIFYFLFTGLNALYAAENPYTFNNPEEEARYQKLLLEVRCAVCQNQSIIDSNAPLAEDLRREVYTKYMAGQSDEDIKAFLVERYGANILYAPPVQANTLLLWLGPACMAFMGLGIWVWRRKR